MAKKTVETAPVVEEQLNKSEAFFLKYKKPIIYCVVAVVVIIAGVVLYNTYVAGPREQKASTELSKAQQLFAQDQFDKALPIFQQVAGEYGSTKAGNLATLYAGLCQAQLGKWEDAVKLLEDFDLQDDQMISPSVEGAIGNAYAHLKKYDEAVKHLKNAAERADNNSLSPTFLIQAGEILESQGKKDEALKLYQTVKDKYFRSMQYQTIDAYIERVSE